VDRYFFRKKTDAALPFKSNRLVFAADFA